MIDRRRFVAATAIGLVPGCAALVTTTVAPVDGKLAIPLAEHPTLDRPGGWLRIRPAGSDTVLYVLAVPEREFVVVSPICKHRGCTVEVAGEILECPCHGSRYSRSGDVLRGPTQAPLDRFPASLSADGVLTVNLEGV